MFVVEWGKRLPCNGEQGLTFLNVSLATALRVEKRRGERGFEVVAYFPPGCLPVESARSARLHHASTRSDASRWLQNLLRQIEERDTVRVKIEAG